MASERTEEEEALASIQGSNPTYSTICPLRDECTRYITKVRYLIVEAQDINSIVEPLQFFAEYKSQSRSSQELLQSSSFKISQQETCNELTLAVEFIIDQTAID